MNCDLLVVGNDEAAVELALQAGLDGHGVISALPVQSHSAWIVRETLRTMTTQLAADFPVARRNQLRRCRETRFVLSLLKRALSREQLLQQQRLLDAGVRVLHGEIQCAGNGLFRIFTPGGRKPLPLRAQSCVVATGIRCGSALAYDGLDRLFSELWLPEQLQIAAGCGVGIGLASLYQLFGVSTELIACVDESDAMLEFASETGVGVVHCSEFEERPFSRSRHESAGMRIDCRRQMGFTDHLQLQQAGVIPDDRGRLWCNDVFETWCEGIYAAGDVIGFSGRVNAPLVDQVRIILSALRGESTSIARSQRTSSGSPSKSQNEMLE